MTFDTVVFNQKELDKAVEKGYKYIALCDGNFILPERDDITYVSIGAVITKIQKRRRRKAETSSGVMSYGIDLI